MKRTEIVDEKFNKLLSVIDLEFLRPLNAYPRSTVDSHSSLRVIYFFNYLFNCKFKFGFQTRFRFTTPPFYKYSNETRLVMTR